MKSSIHTYYIHNAHSVDRRYYLCDTSEQCIDAYEVVRMVKGVPLFLEDHFFRMERSAHLLGHTLFWTMEDFEQSIRLLVEANRISIGNIKLLVQWGKDPRGELFACFIEHHYPSPKQKKEGVPVTLINLQRETPNAKIENRTLREKTDRVIQDSKVYEVLLVDPSGNITEGSRSNFFIIEDDELITPPLASVLPGITRGKIMEIACGMDKKLHQRPIHKKELHAAQAAFLTGTSIGVLPLNRIDTQELTPGHPMLHTIQEAYEKMVFDYLQSHKSVLA